MIPYTNLVTYVEPILVPYLTKKAIHYVKLALRHKVHRKYLKMS